MKLAETHHSENRRYHVFRIFYSILFLTLFTFLTKLQIIESEDFEDQERKQGQRRILHPGARGDVFDRDGKLLIGNKAQFSAVIHLDKLKNEIWEKKVFLKKTAFDSQTDLTLMGNLSYGELNELYLNYRIFILSSFFEGNPKVVLEAFSRGTLVIAKNNKNTREIIENNVNGILFDDFKELNSRVNEIISNKTIFEQITSNAYEKVLKLNLISTIINQELDIYKKLNS